MPSLGVADPPTGIPERPWAARVRYNNSGGHWHGGTNVIDRYVASLARRVEVDLYRQPSSSPPAAAHVQSLERDLSSASPSHHVRPPTCSTHPASACDTTAMLTLHSLYTPMCVDLPRRTFSLPQAGSRPTCSLDRRTASQSLAPPRALSFMDVDVVPQVPARRKADAMDDIKVSIRRTPAYAHVSKRSRLAEDPKVAGRQRKRPDSKLAKVSQFSSMLVVIPDRFCRAARHCSNVQR